MTAAAAALLFPQWVKVARGKSSFWRVLISRQNSEFSAATFPSVSFPVIGDKIKTVGPFCQSGNPHDALLLCKDLLEEA
jgi:hypothetical protein